MENGRKLDGADKERGAQKGGMVMSGRQGREQCNEDKDIFLSQEPFQGWVLQLPSIRVLLGRSDRHPPHLLAVSRPTSPLTKKPWLALGGGAKQTAKVLSLS